MIRSVDAIERSVHKTNEWLSDLADELGTEDREEAWRVLRAYLQSHGHCDGSACVREQYGWTCASASTGAYPRLASCTRRHGYIAAYAAPPPGVD